MRGPKIVACVTNTAGRPFNVFLVSRGDRYGLDDKLTHAKDDPLVEFWDATYEDDERFTPGRGQFVTRYSLSTLVDRAPGTGLDLCGHEPAWKLTAKNVADILAAIDGWLRVAQKLDQKDQDREREMFGCTEAAIDEALAGKEPRDIAMYAMGALSNAQELIQRSEYEGEVDWSVSNSHRANTIRQLMNVAKYAINKAVPR